MIPIRDTLYIWTYAGTYLISRDDECKEMNDNAKYPTGDCRGTFAVSEENPNIAYVIGFEGNVRCLNTEDLNGEYTRTFDKKDLLKD